MLTRRQTIGCAAAAPALGLHVLPWVDPIRQDADRIAVLAEALQAEPLLTGHTGWAQTIIHLAERVPATPAVDDGSWKRECRSALSAIMGYSELLGLHYPSSSPARRLADEITAATGRMALHLPALG